MRKTFLVIVLLSLCAWPLKAQFFLTGDDPGSLRWNYIESAHYKVIYPVGTDSLARVYARSLEQFREPVGRSLQLTPGMKKKFPVVLHTHYQYSNGSVGWAPSRMDLYTHPEMNCPDPVPWYVQLASHEPRHQAQLQYGNRSFLHWLTGEAWAPVHWQLYLEQALGEGDAVAVETGLVSGTRARTSDFLNFYRVALDQGDFRSWDRWRYGSYKHFTPDLYKLGYVTVAGARYLYDDPFIVREALDLSWKKPWMIAPANTFSVIKKHSGKPFKQSFNDILNVFNDVWQADAEARAPFMETERVSPHADFPVDYTDVYIMNDQLHIVREGYLYASEIVTLDQGGKIVDVRPFPDYVTFIFDDDVKKRIYWTETRKHPRWGLSGKSVLCYEDANTGRRYDMSKGEDYHNPAVSADGQSVAVVEILPEGGSRVVVLDSDSFQVERREIVPDGILMVELAWLENDIYSIGVTQGGFGLYKLTPEGAWETVLEPSVQKLTLLDGFDDEKCLEWVSDRSGVGELYRFYPDSKRLLQVTNTRYGGTEFNEFFDYLYFFSQTEEGQQLFRTPIGALQPKEVDFYDVYPYPIEAALTAQEQALGPAPDLTSAVPLSAPKPYHKLTHLLRLHSWMPFYVNYDAVMSGSMDFSYETASIGLSGFFQNNLGTFSGMIGYGLHRDPDVEGAWRNSLHLKATYSGLYPIFEASLDLGDQAAYQYTVSNIIQHYGNAKVQWSQLGAQLRKEPYLQASVRTYIPFSYNKGGILYGFTPQIRYTFTNNRYNIHPAVFEQGLRFDDIPGITSLSQPTDAKGVFMQRLSASLRGYCMRPRAQSQIYPRLGIGSEVGFSLRQGLREYFAPNVYAYVYGYLPGLWRTQGLRLSSTLQHRVGSDIFGEIVANTLPRGFNSAAMRAVGQAFDTQWKFTADYAIPLYFGDISIPYVAYIRNFLITPHFDITALLGQNEYQTIISHSGSIAGRTSSKTIPNLWSVGADISASLGRILFIPFDASIGVGTSYLGGNWFASSNNESRWAVELIFGIDF